MTEKKVNDEKIAGATKEARFTKCSLTLLHHMQNEKENTKLRSLAVSELKGLKAHVGGAEADALVP